MRVDLHRLDEFGASHVVTSSFLADCGSRGGGT